MDNTQLLKRIDAKLTALHNKPKRETWVKVKMLKGLTGWNDKEALRSARNQGLVKMRRTDKGIEYLLESIPEILIKRTA